MSSRQQLIHAPASVVYRLLLDVGGWRIWNRRVAFAEIDGEAQVGARGVLYLRRLPWLPWSLHIDNAVDERRLNICASCLSVHVHIDFELAPDQTSGHVLLRGSLHSDSLLGRLASSKMTPFWHGFLSAAFVGIHYAAESVSATERQIRVH
jgi:hypothetical protein